MMITNDYPTFPTGGDATIPYKERMKQHGKTLNPIAFYKGLNGVTEYKQEHPEAASIRVSINAYSYSVKPPGYVTYILDLAERWIIDPAASRTKNTDDVAALNKHFQTDRFNPTNHFSKPLSATMLAKMKAVFKVHDGILDTSRNNSLSKIKKAASVLQGATSGGRLFSTVGFITGNSLTIGDQSLAINQNGGRDCIRISVDGVRVWQRLDVLEAAFDMIAGSKAVPELPPLTTTCSIGEVVYGADTAEIDPLATIQMGGVYQSPASVLGDVYQSPTFDLEDRAGSPKPPTLAQRIQTLADRSRQGLGLPKDPYSTTDADDPDPLALTDPDAPDPLAS